VLQHKISVSCAKSPLVTPADETRIDNSMDVISYWNLNKSLYPNLARITKQFLAMPATNTSVERIFSHTGNTVTNRRTRLDANKIYYLLFIIY